MTDPIDLDELERLHAEVTPGTWETGLDERNVLAGPFWLKPSTFDNLGGRADTQAKATAKLVVALHNAAPALIAEVRRLRATLLYIQRRGYTGAAYVAQCALDGDDAPKMEADDAPLRR